MKDSTILVLLGAGLGALYLFKKPVSDVACGLGEAVSGLGGGISDIGTAVGDVSGDVAEITGSISNLTTTLLDKLSEKINNIELNNNNNDNVYEDVGKSVVLPPGVNAFQNIIDMWNKLKGGGEKSTSLTPEKSSSPTIALLPEAERKTLNIGLPTSSQYTTNVDELSPIKGFTAFVDKPTSLTPEKSSSSSSSSKSSSFNTNIGGKTYKVEVKTETKPTSWAITKANIEKSNALTKAKYG